MDLEKILKLGIEYLSDYLEDFLRVIRRPGLYLRPTPAANEDPAIGITSSSDTTRLRINPRLIRFLIISIFLGSMLNERIPGRSPVQQLLVIVVILIVYWALFSAVLHLLCRLLGSKVTFTETLSVGLQVFAVVYVLSSLCGFLWGIVALKLTLDLGNKYLLFFRANPIYVYFVVQLPLTLIYLIMGMTRIHQFPFRKRSAVKIFKTALPRLECLALCFVFLVISIIIVAVSKSNYEMHSIPLDQPEMEPLYTRVMVEKAEKPLEETDKPLKRRMNNIRPNSRPTVSAARQSRLLSSNTGTIKDEGGIASTGSNVLVRNHVSKADRKAISSRLRNITGWPDLTFDDENGALRISNTNVRNGSKSARDLLNRIITGQRVIVFEDASSRMDVVFCRVVLGQIGGMEVFVVLIDFADFRQMVGDKQAHAAFNVGWAVLHELIEIGDDSADRQSDVAKDCETRINLMRRELGLPVRNAYFYSSLPVDNDSNPTRYVRLGFDQDTASGKRKRYWLIWDAAAVGNL